MSAGGRWPLWRRDDPAGLLAYVSAGDGLAALLPGLPPRAAGRDGDPLGRLRGVYEAFTAAGIRYADEPVASTGQAQEIRPAGQVLDLPGAGNCLDVSLVFAGACLTAGLHPVLVSCEQDGEGSAHAMVVVWLGGDWPGPGGDGRYPVPGPADGPLVLSAPPQWPGGLRQAAGGSGQFLPIDVTQVLARGGGEPASFDDAVRAACAILCPAMRSAATVGNAGQPADGGPPAGRLWRWAFGLDVGLHYRLETALDLPGQPTLPPLDPPYESPGSSGNGPLAQVRARAGIVPFVDRGELGLLLDWCLAPDSRPGPGHGSPADGGPGQDRVPAVPPVRIAVIEGVGGSGKTRLGAQAARLLADEHGWYTGFAVRRVPAADGLSWLAGVVSPVLLVIDYVEAIETAALAEAIRALTARRSRTVLLFTARARGDWWDRLDRELTGTVSRSVFPELRLPPRLPESARLFSRAYRRFAAAGGPATRDEPPPPASGARWTALDLVMLAWLAARVGSDLPATPAGLYDAVISREIAAWADAMARDNRPRPTGSVLRAAATAVALLSPSPARLAEFLDHPSVRRHTSLAPGEIADSLTGLLGRPGDSALSLTPDPIADYLILTAFPGDLALFDSCVDLIANDAPPAPPGGPRASGWVQDTAGGQTEPERFCDNVTRAGEAFALDQALPTASDLAAAALRRRAGMWPAAFETALNRGGAFTAGLEELAARSDTPMPLREINARIPTGHSSLRQLALTAALRTLAPPTSGEVGSDRAGALNTLAIRLSEVGRREEALAPAQEAVTLRRQLADAAPAAYLGSLAGSLNNLAAFLSEVGRREEALAPAQEAVTAYRQLADAAPAAYLGSLAGSLNNLANRLSEVGRREEALAPAQEAVTAYRQLADAAPAAYLGSLAGSLNNLANRLSEVGRREEALDVFTDVAAKMAAGPRAEICLAQARWLAASPMPSAGASGRAAALAAAVTAADSEDDPAGGARARRAVRAAVAEFGEAALTAEVPSAAPLPSWLAASLPDPVVALLNELLSAAGWAERATMVRQARADVLFSPAGRQARAALASLYADNGPLLGILRVLDEADARGLDTVLAEVTDGEAHAELVRAWLGTPTWTASRQFLSRHPGLLADGRTGSMLAAAAGDRVIRQHLAIARLAAGMGLDEVYDIVLDTADAADAALAGIDSGDLERVAEIWYAAPQLAGVPFAGGYLAAVLLAAGGQSGDAGQVMAAAARQAGQATRQAGAERLRRLAQRRPEHAEVLADLAAVLTGPAPPAAEAPGTS